MKRCETCQCACGLSFASTSARDLCEDTCDDADRDTRRK